MTEQTATPMPTPRPLPLHLAMQTLTYALSLGALPTLRNGSIDWKALLPEKANPANADLTEDEWKQFCAAVAAETDARVRRFADGVAAFTRAVSGPPHRSSLPDVWSEGTTTLRRAEADGPPVVLVPSLVNRAYILDLQPRRSLARYLAASGFDTYLIDWDGPGPDEKRFGFDDYVKRLERVVDHVIAETGQKPAVVGYCMGGNLALALAAVAGDKIAALGLLATPWDFEAMPAAPRTMLAASMPMLRQTLAFMNELPVDVLQAMFASLDPGATARKFRNFAGLDPDGRTAQEFVRLESWLNDGVPLAPKVAEACLQGWYVENLPGRGLWTCCGVTVDPAKIDIPVLCMVPSNDVIVPPETAKPLGVLLPRAETREVKAGHIGMVAGSRAKKVLFEPLAEWLNGTLDESLGHIEKKGHLT